MNLAEFINYRARCPLCDAELTTAFHSRRRQTIRYEGSKVSIGFDLDALDKHHKDYKMSYNFDMLDQSFAIEFYSLVGVQFTDVSPTFLMDRFKKLHNNLTTFKFYRGCTYCTMYAYRSNDFKIDLANGCFEPLAMCVEQFGLSCPVEDYFRCYKLTNFPIEKCTTVSVWKSSGPSFNLDWSDHDQRNTKLRLSLINFVSKEETLERLNKLIIFS